MSASSLPEDEAPVVTVRDVWMSFPGKRGAEPVHVLERVSLDVRRGEFVCIVGPSGCGKSTLLNIIGGFLNASRGETRIEGEPVRGPDARRIFVFQENGVFPWLTVEDNVGFGLLRKSAAERKKIVTHYIDMVGLTGFERSYPRELSGGMRQRVEIARALAANPDIIYMDEPFGALDFLTRLKMRADLVRIWQEEKKTILFVTHDIEEAVQLSDRVVVMSRRPATIQTIVPVTVPRPRDLDSHGYLETRDRIFAAMGMSLKVGEGPSRPKPPEGRTDCQSVPPPKDADVVIIGAGPAGSTLGAYLARAGIDHMILDKAVHPRRHVGESLVCTTTRLFDEIGFLPVMEREGFVRKHGANWVHWADGRQCAVRFRELPELGIAQDYTYHVDRARFDQLLLEHAERLGSRVLQGAHVERVEFGPDGAASGVTVQHGGAQQTLRCKLVVDASGRNSILGTQLKLKRKDPLFNQFAIHSWFEGVDRGTDDTADFIHVHLLPVPRGWAWQIPVSPKVTSVGVVIDGADFPKAGESVEKCFARYIGMNPVLAKRMAGACRLHDFVREGNYSYVMDRFAGAGWVLIGDAARFIDPVFSSGVSVAMESAKRAADAILAALPSGDLNAAAFESYESALRAGGDVWREFILLFYRLPPLFFDLLNQPEARRLALQMLLGEVYDRQSVPILERMRSEIRAVESDPGHRWRPYLSPEPAPQNS